MLAVLLAVLTAPFGSNISGSSPTAPFDDDAFVKAVAIGGMYEGKLSYLVGPQTRNTEVRKFAAVVCANCVTGGAALKEVAQTAGITLPTKLDDTHRKLYETFEKYRGDDLDRDYVKLMVERRTAAVVLFTRASKEAKHPAVKKFAAAALPTLQQHAEAAKSLDR